MSNKYRGEISAQLDGKTYTLRLTLAALAELEEALGGEDILAFARRLAGGEIHARDVIHILGAGLRGGGHDIDDEAAARMSPPGGPAEAMTLAARLIAAAFGAEGEDRRQTP